MSNKNVRHTLNNTMAEKSWVHDNLYWSNDPDENKALLREFYNPVKVRRETQEKHGGLWWVLDASPSFRMEENYLSILDFAGAGFVNAERVHYAALTGAGTFRSISQTGAGMRITTGPNNNDDCTIGGGDNTGLTLAWNVDKEIWYYSQLRFPGTLDLLNVRIIVGLYADANNYLGIRYDTAVDNNLYILSRSAGIEERQSLGVPAPDVWLNLYIHATRNQIEMSTLGQTPRTIRTSIPTVNLSHYAFIRTLAAGAKHLDIRRLIIIQDAVAPPLIW